MKYSIVYNSVTGNTKQLAEAIKSKVGDCYFGDPTNEAKEADTLFVGFWSTRNSCDKDIQSFLEQLSNKKIFLFGTAGYSDAKEYFEEILSNVKSHIPDSNTVIGTYMCQGEVSDSMQNRIKENKPEMYKDIKNNLKESVSHPDENDIKDLMTEVNRVI